MKKYGPLLRFIQLVIFITMLNFSIAHAKVPDIVLKQKNSVVTIYIYENDKVIAYGSGFFIDTDGIIATNYHVISLLLKNPDTALAVKMENKEFIRGERLLSIDEKNDVALIKVEGKGFPLIKLSIDHKPKQGEDVFVIGSPLGFDTTISSGIVSSIRGADEFLQITAPISPGSSGSPVFNVNGDVIGMATLVMQGGQNLNFAIPVKYILNVIKPVQTNEAEALNAVIPSPLSIKQNAEKKEKNFNEHVKLAIEHLKNEHPLGALRECTNAISIKQDNPFVYFMCGYIRKSLKETLGDEIDLEEITQDGKEGVLIKPANVFLTREEAEAWEKQPIADYDKAIALQPNNAAFYYARAKAYSNKRNDKAIKDLDKASTLNPDMPFIYYARGEAYHALKQYKMAIEDFTRGINLKPDKQKYYAINYAPLKELGYIKAVADREYISLPDFYFARAFSYDINLQLNEAIKDYEMCYTMSPDYPDLGMLLSDLYITTGRFRDAIKFYSRLITLYPKNADVYGWRAFFYKETKQFNKAIHDINKSIEIKHSSSWVNFSGSLYSKLKQYDKAIKDYSEAIALEIAAPPSSKLKFYYSDRADVYKKTKQFQKALEDFQKACDLGNKFACEEHEKTKKDMARGENWVLIGTGVNFTFYYDKSTIKKQPNKNKRVWLRGEAKDINALIEERKEQGLPVNGYRDFSHQLALKEVNCNTKEMGRVSFVDYNNKGVPIHSSDANWSLTFTHVIPQSIGESIYKAVCEGNKKGESQ